MTKKNIEFGGWRGFIVNTVISTLISTAVVGGVLKWQLDKELESWRSQRTWQAAALSEVIAPAVIHFERTSVIGHRYRRNPRYGEAVLLRESNNAVRSLLLSKAHLLPNELLAPSGCLLTHYDIWLQRFAITLDKYQKTHSSVPSPDEKFDVGSSETEDPKCGKFPQEVPDLFKLQRNKLMKDVYGFEPKTAKLPPEGSDIDTSQK